MTVPRLVRAALPPPRTLDERSDDELMQLAQAGLREAFASLVERHALRVAHTCARFANDWTAGVELAQETWAELWEDRAQYRPGSDFGMWLLACARNRCRNYLRHRRVVVHHVLQIHHWSADPAPTQIDALLVEERRRQVREALARVPKPMREALLLRYAEGLRYDQMGEICRAGESTLRSRVHHGLRRLRQLLEKNQ